jgi:hypothetical protein
MRSNRCTIDCHRVRPVAHFRDIWVTKLPLKIRIFSWQLVLDELPSNINLVAGHGPGMGTCSLCGFLEDVNASSSTALSLSSSDRGTTVVGCSWCPSIFCNFTLLCLNFWVDICVFCGRFLLPSLRVCGMLETN